MKNVLCLKLQFSRVPKCSIRRSVWDNTPAISQKSGLFSQLGFSGKQQQQKAPVRLVVSQAPSFLLSAIIVATGVWLQRFSMHILMVHIVLSMLAMGELTRRVPGTSLYWRISDIRSFLLQPPFNPNSAVCNKEPKAQPLKLLKFVDITEMKKGPQDMPGHWLVTGAKLDVDGGKISLRVKYSLLHY